MTRSEAAALMRRLHDEMNQARLDFFAVQEQIDGIILDAKSGLPMSDGKQAIMTRAGMPSGRFKSMKTK